ncbi:MAG: ligase-associated DNA damage response exonuclease, partial [Candidatus Puniceispirillaceae bacterium]
LDIMAARYGQGFAQAVTPLAYGERMVLGAAQLSMAPAGHVLGSAQIIVEYNGQRLVAAGDYKRSTDPTCQPFEIVPCDVFITEATFALPVFRHPKPSDEIDKLLQAKYLFPDRTILVGAYALGKAQRIIALLRQAGFNQPVYIHGALRKLCDLYERHGIELGPLLPASAGQAGKAQPDLIGQIVIAPPAAYGSKWAQRLTDPLFAFASGWMQVRQRAKQKGVELPLILSDHADWPDLLHTLKQISPKEVWITHGREDALLHACNKLGIEARALSLVGYEEEAE